MMDKSIWLTPAVLTLLLAGCNATDVGTKDESSSDSTEIPDVVESGEWNITTGENSDDSLDSLSFNTLTVYLSSGSIVSDSSDLVVGTTTDGVTPITSDGDVVITVTEEEYGVTIDSSWEESTLIEYALYEDYDQTVTVLSESDFKLSLNGLSIDSTDGPAINIQSGERAFIVLADGTENYLTDTTTWSDRYLDDGEEMDLKATLFSEGPLIFSGSGSLELESATKHGIASDDHIRISEGSFDISVDKKDGIRANDAFILDDGTVSITTSDGKGIKVEGKEDDTAPIGFITINDGTLDIESNDKGIMAAWESEDGDTTTTDDDPDPRVTINGGKITVETTGEVSNDLTPEGIEAKSVLTINGGEIDVQTSDDALNAGDGIIINDGYIYAAASENDAIDSNGIMTITGGVVVANGAGNAEGGMDCDSNTFTVTGGTFIAIGGRNSSPTASVTTQNTVSLSDIDSGILALVDGSGDVAFAYSMPDSANAVLLSSPNLDTGSSYTVYNGGTVGSYDEEFEGLYIDPASYSGGSSTRSSFTINSTTTTVR